MILTGNAKKEHERSSGTYILQNNLVNGHPHWQHVSNDRALWWTKKTNKWIVGNPIGVESNWNSFEICSIRFENL